MHHKRQSYDVWFLRYEVQRTYFLSFGTIFCTFTPNTPKKSVEKIKKTLEILLFYTCVTINGSHTGCPPKKLYIILNLYKLSCVKLFEKYSHGTNNHHLETYFLSFEAISPLYPFLLRFEFTR